MTTDYLALPSFKEGARDVKRRETHRRIAQEALRLFVERGYAETTVDAIAEAAGISRRTFFAYFKTKDELVTTWQRSRWDDVLDDVRKTSPDERPIKAIRTCMSNALAMYNNEQFKALKSVTDSVESLQAAHAALFVERELLLYRVLCEVWRQPERRLELRLSAMAAIGAMRIALERWEQPTNKRTLSKIFTETIDALTSLQIDGRA